LESDSGFQKKNMGGGGCSVKDSRKRRSVEKRKRKVYGKGSKNMNRLDPNSWGGGDHVKKRIKKNPGELKEKEKVGERRKEGVVTRVIGKKDKEKRFGKLIRGLVQWATFVLIGLKKWEELRGGTRGKLGKGEHRGARSQTTKMGEFRKGFDVK